MMVRSLTGDPNEILEMLTDHIGEIYTTHANVDEEALYRSFFEKYQHEIEDLRQITEVPDFSAFELWSFFQTKPEYKSGGLDRWKVVEIQALPVCAWEAIALFYRLVEHTGTWPPSFKILPIAAIPKSEKTWTPETTRAIGVSSVFYATWSSIRFRHLSSWMTQISPAALLGGLPNRNAIASEFSLSSELFEQEFFEGDARIVLFIDRFKCFDLLLPKFCFNLATELGVPSRIINCIEGFYRGQYKCFKLGQAYGPRVVQTNGLVQGCAFSVLFANLIFAVFAKRIETKPNINFASFIDDTKLWARISDFQALAEAAIDLSFFDSAVGQKQNDKKSLILTKEEKNAQRFLLQVGRQMPKAKEAKSLGFSHKVTRRGGAKLQDARVHRAIKIVAKISKLPLPTSDKGFYIKSNAHRVWVYGSEIQGPSKGSLKKLRTAVVNCIFPRKNKMRCPYLAVSTHSDIWVDPWAKWVHHVLSTYRKLARSDPELAHKILAQARKYNVRDNDTRNGAPVVLARIFKELHWEPVGDTFVFQRQNDVDFNLNYGSQQFFSSELERSIRHRLFLQSAQRHENLWDVRDRPLDIPLMRFLVDNDMTDYDLSGVVASKLRSLPVSMQHARRILQFLFTGSMFDGPRKFNAGLATSDCCQHCFETATRLHIFQQCPYLQKPDIPDSVPNTSWTTGIIFEDDSVLDRRKKLFHQHDHVPHGRPYLLHHNLDIFIDGSCFYSKCRRFARAAVGIYSPEVGSFSFPVEGSDHSSQRAEIFALAIALRLFSGNVTVYSDCATVVKGYELLQNNGFELSVLKGWDNLDAWESVCKAETRRLGTATVLKVAAHGRCKNQNPDLSEGNRKADELAKACADQLFKDQLDDLTI